MESYCQVSLVKEILDVFCRLVYGNDVCAVICLRRESKDRDFRSKCKSDV